MGNERVNLKRVAEDGGGEYSYIARLWLKHGGSQHGPRVEHYDIPEEGFWNFIAELKRDLS